MLMFDFAVGDGACQISATPGMAFARVTRAHVRPPPLIVRLWPPPLGPPAEANAMTRSPADVVNGPVVAMPVPSANTAVRTDGLICACAVAAAALTRRMTVKNRARHCRNAQRAPEWRNRGPVMMAVAWASHRPAGDRGDAAGNGCSPRELRPTVALATGGPGRCDSLYDRPMTFWRRESSDVGVRAVAETCQ